MKVLILGGGIFVGKAILSECLAQGLDVTLFNRGNSIKKEQLPPGVKLIRGDRETDLHLLKDHSFDVVIDTCGYFPSTVKKSVDVFSGSGACYLFISTLSVYSAFGKELISETSAVFPESALPEDLKLSDNLYAPGLYGMRKAACERIVLNGFKGRTLIVRPGIIAGPHDPTDRLTFWINRIADGGETLVPDSPEVPVEVIDVRDVAEFVVKLAQTPERNGIFNASSPNAIFSFNDFIRSCVKVAKSSAQLFWVDPDFLLEQNVKPWEDLPLWRPDFSHKTDLKKSLEAGLTLRPIEETIAATLEWNKERMKKFYSVAPGTALPFEAFLSRAREREILNEARFG